MEKGSYKTLKQAEAEIDVTARQLQWMIRKGVLPAYQPGGRRGRLYIRREDLEALMQPVQRGQR